MGFMDILTHLTKIQLKFEAELRGIRPNEIKLNICIIIDPLQVKPYFLFPKP